MQLQVTLTKEKASRWHAIILKHIADDTITQIELEKLLGKLCFSKTCLFGKFARTQLRRLYRKLHTKTYTAKLTKLEKMSLRWWADVIISLRRRIPRKPGRTAEFVLYTDAATSTNRVAALLFRGATPPPLQL